MLWALLFFSCGISLLLFASQYLITGASSLSTRLRISPLVAGMTIVAIGTSLPEMVVSVMAAAKGDVSLAAGNIFGSNFSNIFLIFAIALLIGSIKIGRDRTVANTLFLAVTTPVFITLQFLLSPPWIGLCLLGLVIFFSYQLVRKNSQEHLLLKISARALKKEKIIRYDWLICCVAVLGVSTGGWLVVDGVERLSLLLSISTSFFGLTLTALTTSFPELLTTILSARRHQEKLALGNIIGSNIYNLLLIGGGLSLAYRLPITDFELIALLSSSAAISLLVFFFRGERIPRWTALFLLLGYSVYIVMTYYFQR